MPRYVGIMHINFGSVGWSEIYPLLLTDAPTLVSEWALICAARLPILGTDAHLAGDLLSDTDVKGDSIPSGQVYPQAGTGGSACFPQFDIGLGIKVTDVTFVHRGTRWLRGIPTAQFTAGAYAPLGPFLAALAAYEAALTHASLCIASRIKGALAPPFFNYYRVNQYFPPVDRAKKTGRPFGLSRGRRLIA
jgi:hypothetical protein